MFYQNVFERYELKFLLTLSQKEKVLKAMEPYMALDEYGRSVIRNLYFDTENYRLVRKSMERPVYKEKLRVRSYELATDKSTVFVELKKKYESIVYKRRLPLSERDAMNFLQGASGSGDTSQIAKEIDYFIRYYETLHPTVFLSYEREAFYSLGGDDFRVTFDDRILCRRDDLSLRSEVYGTPLLDDGTVLMEIKCSGGVPLWMTSVLSEEHIYKTSFSKYGTAYEKLIFNKVREASYA